MVAQKRPPLPRILIVDDQPALLDISARFLERIGCEVECCLSAEEAWQKLSDGEHDYDVVVIDIVMPGISGLELCRRLLDLDPQQSVILWSGHPLDLEKIDVRYRDKLHFLLKPFTSTLLIETVERALKSKPTKKPALKRRAF